MLSQEAGLVTVEETAHSPDFETFFHTHYKRLYGFLFRLVGNRAEAEDLAIESFCKLWQQPPASEENLPGWLFRVASRLGLNALRSSRRRSYYEERAAALQNAAVPDSSIALEKEQQRKQVRQILADLPKRYSRVLLLRYSGLSYKEIASALDVSVGSVGTILARAEREFQKKFTGGTKHASV